MSKPVINLADIKPVPRPPAFAPEGAAADIYEANTAYVSRQLGARQLGYNITCVPPGKAAYPYHNHRVNEEMFLILEGEAELRLGQETFTVTTGDIIACPAGDAVHAHQLKNTGTTELRYLAVSTKLGPEICEYPDSGKFGILAELTDSSGAPEMFVHLGRAEQCLDYWED